MCAGRGEVTNASASPTCLPSASDFEGITESKVSMAVHRVRTAVVRVWMLAVLDLRDGRPVITMTVRGGDKAKGGPRWEETHEVARFFFVL